MGQHKRTMGLDIGMRRIGVAISDALGLTAQPIETVQVSPRGGKAHIARIAELVAEHGVEEIVAGVPLEMSGKAGTMARRVRRMLTQIEAATGQTIIELDERLTTRQAERALKQGKVGWQQRRDVVDQVAASIILQAHLNAQAR